MGNDNKWARSTSFLLLLFAGITVRRLQSARGFREQETSRERSSRNFHGAMGAAEPDRWECECRVLIWYRTKISHNVEIGMNFFVSRVWNHFENISLSGEQSTLYKVFGNSHLLFLITLRYSSNWVEEFRGTLSRDECSLFEHLRAKVV